MSQNKEYQMLKEILEQPEVIRDILNCYIDIKTGEVNFPEFKGRLNAIKNIDRITLLGCGTSAYAAEIGNYIMEEYSSLPCEFEMADQFVVRKKVVENRTAVIVLSQSGETGDVIKAVKQVKKKDIFVIGISNHEDSSLKELVDVMISIGAGEEKAVEATKSFTAELTILSLLSVFIGRLHKMSPASGKIVVQELRLLPDKISKALKLEPEMIAIAKEVSCYKDILFLGRKYCYPLALEAAHKFKEATYIHAEGGSSEAFVHGPIAIVEPGYLVVFFAPVDSVYEENIKILKRLKKQGAHIIAITTKGNKKLKNNADHVLHIFPAAEAFVPIIGIVPIQLLAFYVALEKGIDVDAPRNITKFVG